MAHSTVLRPSRWSRPLGVGGVVAGIVLVSAFVVPIEQSLNPYRLIAYFAGVIAVVVGVDLRQRAVAPPLARLSAGALVLACGWYLAMTVLRLVVVNPFGANFGFVEFLAGVSLWLSAALFGGTTYAIGAFSRVGPALLVIGSLLAITGLDRLGLTSSGHETTFGPLSLVGIALHGCGWILLGTDLAFRRRVGTTAFMATFAILLVACSPAAIAQPSRSALPAGWSVTESGAGDLRLALPPDIIAFDTSGAIFANQPPPRSSGDWIQVMAEAPATAVPQPDPGEPLERRLERLWFANEPGGSGTSTRTLDLAAGQAVELRGTLSPGTAYERAVILYAIRTPAGVGRLVIDGPPEAMHLRSADLLLIPRLIELGVRR